jgi:hypothetical protein
MSEVGRPDLEAEFSWRLDRGIARFRLLTDYVRGLRELGYSAEEIVLQLHEAADQVKGRHHV